MKRVAVVGGGFAGIYAIKELQNVTDCEICLFEPRERFVFTPLLHEVAADVLHVPAITHKYTDIFHKNLKHIQSKVTDINLKKKMLTADREYDFDYIIVCTGAKTWMPTPMNVHELKSIEDALKIRRAVEDNVRKASQEHSDALLSCIIVGGGPTGIELAVELQQFYKCRLKKEFHGHEPSITVIQSGKILKNIDSCVQKMAEKKLKKKGINVIDGKVKSVDGKVVKTEKEMLHAELVIWTAGVVPQAPKIDVDLLKGHLPRSDTLQIPGYDFAFAIGDVASKDKLAQAAVQEGTFAAKNLKRFDMEKELKKYSFSSKGFLMSLGQKDGVGIISGICVSGFLAWFMWRTVYLLKFVGVRSRWQLASEYTIRLFTRKHRKNVDTF